MKFRGSMSVATIVLLVSAMVGCEKPDIDEYIAPKDPPPPGSSGKQLPESSPSGRQLSGDIRWTTPDHWRPATNLSSILTAAFDIESESGPVRATVTSLAGSAGGTLANLNRWRQQVGLSPVSSLSEQVVERIDIDGEPGIVFDLSAPAGSDAGRSRIRVALLVHGDTSWFFKLTGPEEAVESESNAFDEFVASVRFEGDRQ